MAIKSNINNKISEINTLDQLGNSNEVVVFSNTPGEKIIAIEKKEFLIEIDNTTLDFNQGLNVNYSVTSNQGGVSTINLPLISDYITIVRSTDVANRTGEITITNFQNQVLRLSTQGNDEILKIGNTRFDLQANESVILGLVFDENLTFSNKTGYKVLSSYFESQNLINNFDSQLANKEDLSNKVINLNLPNNSQYPTTQAVVNGLTTKSRGKAIDRVSALVNVAPTLAEFPAPLNGDTATVKLSSGALEGWNYASGTWTRAYIVNPAVFDGNDKHIVRASTTQNVAPTATEIATPVNGDTAKVFLTDGTIEYWNFQTTWTRDITKLSELTNVRYTTIAPNVIPITDKQGDIAIRTSTGTATGTILGTYVFDGVVWTLISGQDDLVDVSGVVFPLTFPLTTLTGTPVFLPNTPATTGVTYAISDGTNLAYAKWNGTQYISAPAPATPNSFWYSGTGTTKPDGFLDGTKNVSRIGRTGFGILDSSTVTATADIDGTLQVRPIFIVSVPVDVTNSGVVYKSFEISNAQVLTASNIEITGVTVDTVTNIGVGATQSTVDLATLKGRHLTLSNSSQSTHKLTYKGVDIFPGKFLNLIHNGKMWVSESELVENFEQFDLINPDVLIPAFSSGTTTYVDVPNASFIAPTSGDYLVKYVLYASNGSQINPTKRANDVKWTTDNVLNTFVEIAGSVAEIGTSIGAEINSYTRYFRVRTTRPNQVVKMQLNSLSGTTTTYQSATQLSSFNWSRYNSVVAGQQLTNTLIETGAILANNDLFPIVDVSDGVTANQSSYMHRVKQLSNSVLAQQEALTNANSGIIPQTMLQNGITVSVDGWIDYNGSYVSPITLPVPLYDGQIFQVNHLATLATTILGTNTSTGIDTILDNPNTAAMWRAVANKWYRVDNVESKIVETGTAAYTVLGTDHTIILNAPTLQTLTIPASAGVLNREFIIVNNGTVDKVLSQSYTRFDGVTTTVIPAQSSITIQSTGVLYKQTDAGFAPKLSGNIITVLTNVTPATLLNVDGLFEISMAASTDVRIRSFVNRSIYMISEGEYPGGSFSTSSAALVNLTPTFINADNGVHVAGEFNIIKVQDVLTNTIYKITVWRFGAITGNYSAWVEKIGVTSQQILTAGTGITLINGVIASTIGTTTRAIVRANTMTAVASGGTGTVITFANEELDTTNSFNPATGTFVAPRTAQYRVSCQFFVGTSNSAIGNRFGVLLSTNGSSFGAGNPIISYFTASLNPASVAFGGSYIKTLTAGSSLTFRAFLDGATAMTLSGNANFDYITIEEISPNF